MFKAIKKKIGTRSNRFTSGVGRTSLRPFYTSIKVLLCLVLSWIFIASPTLVLARRHSPSTPVSPVKALAMAVQAPRRQGELLVKFRNTIGTRDKDAVASTHGLRRRKGLRGSSGFDKLQVVSGTDVQTAALQLMLDPSVEYAEPNFLVKNDQLGNAPNDPKFNEQWFLQNIGQSGGQFGSDINVSPAWSRTTGSSSVVVAIIDSGIDFSHPDLVDNQWTNANPSNGDLHGWDYVSDSGQIKDEQGHGTSIAGIVAASGNNSVGVSGVMWRASLMSLRVLDETGTGDVANAIEAIDYAVTHGAQVINLSWGTAGESQALRQAIVRAIQNDVAVVCSAGNTSQNVDATPYYPASFGLKNLTTVASSDNFDQLTTWSNWGRRKVTIAAPGVDILTTKMGGGYWNVTGTSASAPIVSGVIGLLRSARPWLPLNVVNKALDDGARRVVSLSGKVSSGGVLDAQGAFGALPPSGNGNGNGGGTGPRGGTAHGPGGTATTPPPVTSGAPAPGLPNLEQLRTSVPTPAKAKTPIQSNLMCADCDPQSGGGGSTNYPSGDPNFSTARLQSENEVGQPGEDAGSQNFNWSTSLLDLPGRSGLDLNLTLNYNSLVWTRDQILGDTYIKYNPDFGSPAPGFRIGLPVLQRPFHSRFAGVDSFIMILPTGMRVEMRRVGTSNIYESQDSSYTQLTDNGTNGAIVRTTDGMQYSFVKVTVNNEYRCNQIKDRNGNYISATYNTTNGHLLTITDTLARTISFIYDANSNLQAIRQTWAGGSHDWATFNYGEVYVSPSFDSNIFVNGPNGSYVTVLTQVNLDDGSYFTFNYNAAFGQVKKISRYAADDHLLNYTSYNMSSAAGQTDCPRFSERRDWAQDRNGDTNGVPATGEEAVTTFAVDAIGGNWAKVTLPDGTVHKDIFATSGWQKGLATTSKDYANVADANTDTPKKWITTTWTQDDENLTYAKNPRVAETNVYDADNNRRRVTTSYHSQFGLPHIVTEYGTGGTYPVRYTYHDYKTDSTYLDRRIIGLAEWVQVFDASWNLMSKTQYAYDWDWNGDMFQDTPAAATQHDRTNYGPTLIYGRGNLSLISRWDVTDPTNANKVVEKKWRVNSTGSVLVERDHLWHEKQFDYGDSFSDNVNRNTFAYVTSVTDEDGSVSTLKHNFDHGALMRTQAPPASGQTNGKIENYFYDSAGRIEKVATEITGNSDYSHRRYEYPTSMTTVKQYATINNSTEAYSVQLLDGGGRLRAFAQDFPGSTGGYKGASLIYDVAGRVTQSSNPTEINASWVPAGDDASGWTWVLQTYDWNGRPLLTTNPDGWTRENVYGGCGCAGGEVVTTRDEAGRRRRSTKDTLGRLAKVEELHWNQSVYSTTTYTFNVLDQITEITQQGSRPRSFVYDGLARLKQQTSPEQGTRNFTYYRDDALESVTDGRGAKSNLAYNARHLLTGVTYDITQASGVVSTPSVSFAYDAAGNRTSATDGLGSTTYAYDQLSRLTSETRSFTSIGASLTLGYGYNVSGELTSLTMPGNVQVTYGYDKTGQLTDVGGSGYGGVTNYASGLSYRAFGAIKGINYGNGRSLSVSYDNRLRPTRANTTNVLDNKYLYDYFNEHTGRVTYVQNMLDSTLDRSYEYDQVGRLAIAHSGAEAHAHAYSGQWGTMDGPFSLGFNYDTWGNMTGRYGWGGEVQGGSAGQTSNIYYTYTAKNQRTDFGYDGAGNLTNDLGQTYTYDATGQQKSASYSGYQLDQYYDADRLRISKVDAGNATYYLRSTVLKGQVVGEYNSSSTLLRGYVYLGDQVLAVQQSSAVNWVHQDPITKSKRVTNSAGTIVSTIELDPWGADTTRSNSATLQPQIFTSYTRDGNASDEAMFRRYNRRHSRFDQPDPYDGSLDPSNPQSLNRYTYTFNDPVNYTDPTGLICWARFEVTTIIDGLGGETEHWKFLGFYCDLSATSVPIPSWRPFGRIEHRALPKALGKQLEAAEVQRRVTLAAAWDKWKKYSDCHDTLQKAFRTQEQNYLSNQTGPEVGATAVGTATFVFGAQPLASAPAILVILNQRAAVKTIHQNFKDAVREQCGREIAKPGEMP